MRLARVWEKAFRTDLRTDGRTDGRTNPLKEMRGRTLKDGTKKMNVLLMRLLSITEQIPVKYQYKYNYARESIYSPNSVRLVNTALS